MPKKVVSLGDIAVAAGVTRMTVSLALRNQPGRVSDAVRKRIVAAADKLGYQPDARIASWMSQVRASKIREPIPIAWLNADKDEDVWHWKKELMPYLEGAQKRCEELGFYLVDDFWLRTPGMTGRRMSQILFNRGIRGVIITPFDKIFRIRLDWQNFAVASFDNSLVAPRLHQVSQDHHYNTMLALKHLRRFGYRRIGVFLSAWAEARSYHACAGAVAYFQQQIPVEERVPVLPQKYSFEPGAEFGPWLREYKPDVIVGQHSELVRWLEAEKYRVPNDIGVVHMSLEDDCLDWAGVRSGKREIGAATAELVIAQLHNNSFGLPTTSHDVRISGRWHPGRTLLAPKLSEKPKSRRRSA